jgi:hypothetical protein
LKYLRVLKSVRYLDLMGFKYTKADLEIIVYRQLSYLEVLGEKVKLLEKQNGLLLKYNNKLMEELGETEVLVPYPKLGRNRRNDRQETLAAESQVKPKKGR